MGARDGDRHVTSCSVIACAAVIGDGDGVRCRNRFTGSKVLSEAVGKVKAPNNRTIVGSCLSQAQSTAECCCQTARNRRAGCRGVRQRNGGCENIRIVDFGEGYGSTIGQHWCGCIFGNRTIHINNRDRWRIVGASDDNRHVASRCVVASPTVIGDRDRVNGCDCFTSSQVLCEAVG